MKKYFYISLIILLWIVTGSFCQEDDQPLIYTYDTSSIPLERCDDGSLRKCYDGSCIPEEYYCNGMLDCKTGEDEQNCKTCPLNFCPCMDGLCISVFDHCSGKMECNMEGEDERQCSPYQQPERIWNFYNNKKQCVFEERYHDRSLYQAINCSDMELVSLPCIVDPNLGFLILNNNKLGLFSGLQNSPFSINRFTRLRVLELEKNVLTNLPVKVFEGLPFLEELSLADNQIRSLNETAFPRNLKNLIKLQLQKNKIKDISPKAFQNLNSLRILSLSDNEIKYLEEGIFNYQANLEILDLTRNNITKLMSGSFSGLANLKFLVLSHNQIEIIDKHTFYEFENLTELYLNFNKVTKLAQIMFQFLKNLNKLYLQYNDISIIENCTFCGLYNLKTLDLSHNNLNHLLPETFQNLSSLQILALNDNNVVKIQDDTFSELRRLDQLLINRNHITKLPIVPYPWDLYDISENEIEELPDQPFYGTIRVKLCLNDNKLKRLKSGMFSGARTTYIHLNNNQINVIENHTFEDLQATGFNELGQLYLNSNHLTEITSYTFEGIGGGSWFLFLNDNKITTIADYAFASMEYHLFSLDLSNNTLTKVSSKMFQRIDNIHYLTLQNNRIQSIESYSFNGTENLELLNLSSNSLTELPSYAFWDLHNLLHLYLHFNKIQRIEMNAFSDLTNLASLDLSNNKLITLRSNLFGDLPRLRSLYLHNNKINNIENHAFKNLKILNTLDLSNNEITSLLPNILSDSKLLRSLQLQNNKIKTIDEFVFSQLFVLQTFKGFWRSPVLRSVRHSVFEGIRRLKLLVADEFRFCCLKNNTKTCQSPMNEFSSCEDLMKNTLLRMFVWILGIIAIFANLFVIIFRLKYHSTNTNKINSFLIKNLAMSDLFMGVYLLIIATTDTVYRGEYYVYDASWRQSFLCNLAGFLSTFSSELTVFILTVLSVDRLYALSSPLRAKQRSVGRTKNMMAIVWILAAIISLIPLPLFNIPYFENFYGRSGVCLPLHITTDTPKGWQYSVFVFIILNSVSFAVIAASYILMHRTTSRARRGISSSNQGTGTAMAFRMTLLVVADAACWMPIIILGVRSLVGIHLSPDVYPWIAVFVLPLNAALNPVLYTLSSIPMIIKVKFANTRLNGKLVFKWPCHFNWPCRWEAANQSQSRRKVQQRELQTFRS